MPHTEARYSKLPVRPYHVTKVLIICCSYAFYSWDIASKKEIEHLRADDIFCWFFRILPSEKCRKFYVILCMCINHAFNTLVFLSTESSFTISKFNQKNSEYTLSYELGKVYEKLKCVKTWIDYQIQHAMRMCDVSLNSIPFNRVLRTFSTVFDSDNCVW